MNMMNTTGIVIGRPINGISINGLEYLLDDAGDFHHFSTVDAAKQFLRDNGVDDEEALKEGFRYIQHTYCAGCGKEYFLEPSEVAEHGYYCDECRASHK